MEQQTETLEAQDNVMEETPKKTNAWKVVLIVFCCLLVVVCSVLGVLQLGVEHSRNTWQQWNPTYEKEDIEPLLKKNILTKADYNTIYRQTGLTRVAVDDMRESSYGRRKILKIQDFFFEKHNVIEKKFTVFTYMNEMPNEYAHLAMLKDGDIIVTSTTYVSWWRYGHAGLVVDGENEQMVESLSPGTISKKTSAWNFTYLANFIVLRPKASSAVKAQVVNYAKEKLVGIPYNMVTGILTEKNPKTLKGTQCAHLVWYAYKKFGIDLDSNGGAIVKPQDMFLSNQVDVVQVFGFDLDTLWK